jgi:membrane-associated phospholipid phosphatase
LGRGFDDVLSRVDRALLHVDHLHLPGAPLSRAGVEVMSLFYLLHIASVYVALAHHGLGRDAAHREEFLLGLVLTYSVAYAGYLLVPAHGPIAFHAADFAGELRGHGIHRATTAAVLASGGAIGAFPSLHVGGSLYLCLFDLRKNRLRAATYAPVVAMVALSTIYLRFHFVVDWLGGAAVALFAFAVTPRVLAAWSRRVPEEEPAS